MTEPVIDKPEVLFEELAAVEEFVAVEELTQPLPTPEDQAVAKELQAAEIARLFGELESARQDVAQSGHIPPVTEAEQAAYDTAVNKLLDTRNSIAVMNQPLVTYLAGRFAHRGVPTEDLRQVGNIGLIKAINRFDLARGFKFSTFATPTIVGEIKRYFRDRYPMLKIPRRIQEADMAIRGTGNILAEKNGHAPGAADYADFYGLQREDVDAALRQNYAVTSLDKSALGEDGDGTLVDLITDKRSAIALNTVEDSLVVEELLERANIGEREREIIRLRFYEGLIQSEIAQRIGISQMHVSRLLRRTIDALRPFAEPAYGY